MNTKKVKVLIFIVCLFLIIFFVHFCFSYDSFFSIDDVDFSTLKQNDAFVVGITDSNNVGAYDMKTQTYFFTKNTFSLNNLKVFSPYEVRYNIKKISDDEYNIIIYSDKYYQSRSIKLLNNSIISIYNFREIGDYEYLDFNALNSHNRSDVGVVFQIMDNDYHEHSSRINSFNSKAKLRIRGASSTFFPKKSFKLELPSDQSLLGMNFATDWVLDALYMDKSKIRNLLSYDLWNNINDNQVINNDLNGEFVEVFLNNEYDGLFVLKQKVDKEVTNVSKYGFLAKSVNHITDDIILEFKNADISSVEDDCKFVLGNLELKYCTFDSLNDFIDKINVYYSELNYSNLLSDFEMNNYINYYVFVSFIYGGDNVSKNLYYSLVDGNSKILITPWDLDLTWGLHWDSHDDMRSQFLIESSTDGAWLDDNIISRMDFKTFSLFKQRYWELRRDVITMDTINSYLDSYKELLVNSGTAKRDSERWYEYDIEFEIEQIREWARLRIEFLDEYFA